MRTLLLLAVVAFVALLAGCAKKDSNAKSNSPDTPSVNVDDNREMAEDDNLDYDNNETPMPGKVNEPVDDDGDGYSDDGVDLEPDGDASDSN